MQAIRRQPMTVYGDGKQTRSFQYVSDLVHYIVILFSYNFTTCFAAMSCYDISIPHNLLAFQPFSLEGHRREPSIRTNGSNLSFKPTMVNSS